MESKTYKEQKDIENIKRLRVIMKELPRFCSQYFLSLETTKSTRTRLNYAYDLRIFFNYIKENNPLYSNLDITNFKLDVLDNLTAMDIEEFVSYLQSYYYNDKHRSNKNPGISRKLSAIRSMYNYFYKKELISSNPAIQVDNPKFHSKNIIRLDTDEIALMLDYIENGTKLTDTQLRFHKRNRIRDVAIVTLLLGTGVRVSECVGLNINDVDFKNNCIKIIRKGGNEDIVYFGDEVANALIDYIENVRKELKPIDGHEEALFISLKNQRITTRSVERLVKKYAQNVTTLKKITPHKLRSTYGTNLYKQTGDIYLVADVLGHKDVNTTKKHYAAIQDDRKRYAASVIKLREN